MKIDINGDDMRLILDALAMAASRKEAQANAVKFGRHHDEAAKRMRELRLILMKAAKAAWLSPAPQ